MAVVLSNCDDEPGIGVIKKITSETTFEIHYWKGTYGGKWSPQKVPYRRVPWTEELPKTCVILHSFDLTGDMKLQTTTRRHLMEKYASLKNTGLAWQTENGGFLLEVSRYPFAHI